LFHSKNIYPLLFPWADPGFQVRGEYLKKLHRGEGGAKIFGVFRVKNHDFTPKNHIFSNCFLGGRGPGAPPPPGSAPASLLQGKHLTFTPSPLRLNIFLLFVILSLTQLYRYTPEIFLFSTATFKYKYRASLRRIGQEYSAKVAFSTFQSLKRIQSHPSVLNWFRN
jgi:hypothetical protein